MYSVRALIRQMSLVLLEYCSFSKVVLQYQYQGFSIVLQYKTARLVHPWILGASVNFVAEFRSYRRQTNICIIASYPENRKARSNRIKHEDRNCVMDNFDSKTCSFRHIKSFTRIPVENVNSFIIFT